MMNLQHMADATGLTLAECRAYRIEYLIRHIKELSEDVAWLADDGGELSALFCQSVFQGLLVESKDDIPFETKLSPCGQYHYAGDDRTGKAVPY